MPDAGRRAGRAPFSAALTIALVVLAAAAVGWPSLFPGFIHDDHRIIEQNELIRGLGHLPQILTRGYWTVNETEVPNLYRPVTILSFALNDSLTGLDPLGFRLVDLLLHLVMAALVCLAARRLLCEDGDQPASGKALLAGLLFAVLPVHTEVLGLVVGRSEILAGCGAFLAILLFLRGRDLAEAGRPAAARGSFVLSLASFALAFLSKENAVVVPLMVLAADWAQRRGRSAAPAAAPAGDSAPARAVAWRYHAAAGGLLLALLALRAKILAGLGLRAFTHFVDNPIAHQPFLEGRLTALKTMARYAGLLLFPRHLSIDYSYDAIPPAASILEPGVLLGALVLGLVASGLAFFWKRRPEIALALLFIALPLLPVSNLLFPIGTIMAERLLYLPSAGFCLLAAACLPRRDRLPVMTRRLLGPAIALALALLAWRSVARFADWRDDRAIFAAAIHVAPRSVRAQYNYGVASESIGDDHSAEQAYRAALSVWDGFADAQYNLAGLLARRREWDEAIAHYRAALSDQPGNVAYLVNMGHTLNQAGRPGESIEPLERAVSLDRASDRGWNTLGAAYLALRRPKDAARAYAEAARLDPRNAEYQTNLGLAWETAGEPAQAAQAYAAAAALSPGDAILRYRLGKVLEQSGRTPEAESAYRESIRLSPESPVPLKSLGLLLARTEERQPAREALERCAALDPGGHVMDEEARRVLRALQK